MNINRVSTLRAGAFLSALALVLFSLSTCKTAPAQQSSKTVSDPTKWEAIDSLLALGRPASALPLVEDIITQSKGNSFGDYYRALVYLADINSETQDPGPLRSIERMEQELRQLRQNPAGLERERAALEAYVALLYAQYMQYHRWTILERGSSFSQSADLRSWSLQNFVERIQQGFTSALSEPLILQNTDLAPFSRALKEKDAASDRRLRPSLFDVIAHEAISFYSSAESGLSRPMDIFRPDQPLLFAGSADFASALIPSPDSLNFHFQALLLYQKLSRFHLEREDTRALLQLDLDRLAFAYSISSVPEKAELYRQALIELQKECGEDELCASVPFARAKWYAEQAIPDGGSTKDHSPEKASYRKEAAALARQCIQDWPGSFGAKSAEALLQHLEYPSLSAVLEAFLPPQREALFLLQYRNVDQAYFRLIRHDDALKAALNEETVHAERIKRLLAAPVLENWSLNLPAHEDLNSHSVEAALPALEFGSYILIFSSSPDFDPELAGIGRADFQVSRMAVLSSAADEGGLDIMVVDRHSGLPLPGVQMAYYHRRYDYSTRKTEEDQVATLLSGPNGELSIEGIREHRTLSLKFSLNGDQLHMDNPVYIPVLSSSKEQQRPIVRSFLFSDRSIYRPGQNIYIKGIIIQQQLNRPEKPLTGMETELSFHDVNGEEIARQTVKTNDFGSYSAIFTAPASGLSGSMSIRDEHGSLQIQVEEYKRPRFEVLLQDPEGELSLGDEVHVSGSAKAYTGAPLAGSRVEYRVQRSPRFPWWWHSSFAYRDMRPGFPYSSSSREIAQGVVQCDEQGQFQLSFTASDDDLERVQGRYAPEYQYSVEVQVTDPSGETRSAQKDIVLGRAAFRIELELPINVTTLNGQQIWDRESLPSFQIKTLNSADREIDVALSARLIPLSSKGRWIRERLWPQPDQYTMDYEEFTRRFPTDTYDDREEPVNRKETRPIWERDLSANERQISIKADYEWPAGEYALLIFGQDASGQEVAIEHYIYLYSSKNNTAPPYQYLWLDGAQSSLEPGELLSFRAGTALDQVRPFYHLRRGQETLSRKWLRNDGQLEQVERRIEDSDRGGLQMEIIQVAHNRVHHLEQRVNVPWSNKDLQVSLERFRDRMDPGTEQSWTLRISGPDSEASSAELLIGMYDASLDALLPHSWQTWTFPNNQHYSRWSGMGFDQIQVSTRAFNPRAYPAYPSRQYDRLFTGRLNTGIWSGGPFRGGRGGIDVTYMQDGVKAQGLAESRADDTAPSLKEKGGMQESEKSIAPPLRSDFRETAFFFPQLRSGKDGSISFSFSAPESLTRWRIMGMAHDIALRYGVLEDTAFSSKDLMVMPNFPRFLREGDRMVLSTRLDNRGDAALSGTVELKLFNALNGKPVDGAFGHAMPELPFQVEAGSNTVLSWLIAVPRGVGAVRYELRATSGQYSDGETAVLPVLPKRMLVRESFAFRTSPDGSRKIIWDAFAERAGRSENQQFTLEFTPNPAWYAVQALPYMMEYPHQCSEQIFSRYYANRIGSWLVAENPQIGDVFDLWKGSDALLSGLEKNQDLKSLLIEETPWLREARDESQRKQRLGVLLDANRMRYESTAAMDELINAQSPNGGWPWFAGGNDNEYITRHIVAGLGHLDQLGVKDIRADHRVWTTLAHAVAYLDARAAERWTEGSSERGEYLSTTADLHYFYARSFFSDLEIPSNLIKTFGERLTAESEGWLERSIYKQALLALALHRWKASGIREFKEQPWESLPEQILLSLKERAQNSEELGMWWPQNKAGYFWYEAPIETQALLIEAFDQIVEDAASVEAMKAWLLSQKQTRSWASTRATAEACYALLATGTDLLDEDGSVSLIIAGEELEGDMSEAGTGYIRRDYSAAEIKPELAAVELISSPGKVSWGALHWQYFEDMDAVIPAGGAMSIRKTLYREVPGERGPELKELSENDALQIGDKLLTRLLISSDRDLEFVHLKDSRASGLEALDVLSGYAWKAGLGFYQSPRDAASHFFMDFLPRGTWMFEYESRAFQAGDFSVGPATIQCMYAPEFAAHSSGGRLTIDARKRP